MKRPVKINVQCIPCNRSLLKYPPRDFPTQDPLTPAACSCFSLPPAHCPLPAVVPPKTRQPLVQPFSPQPFHLTATSPPNTREPWPPARAPHSALSTQHSALNGWDSEQAGEIGVALSVHPRHSVWRCPGRAPIMSDLMMLQGLAERVVPPRSGGGRSQKVAQSGLLGVFQHLYTSVNGVGNRGARASTARDWAAEIGR